jgi:subtilisin family serine protease
MTLLPPVRFSLVALLAALLAILPLELVRGDDGTVSIKPSSAMADDDDDDDGPPRRSGSGDVRRPSGGGGNLFQRLFPRNPPALARRPSRPATPPPISAPRELVAVGLGTDGLASLIAEGFTLVSERAVAGRGSLVRLRIPDALAEAAALDRIAQIDPGAIADLNHYYRPDAAASEAVEDCTAGICDAWSLIGWPTSGLAGCAADVTIGVVDTGVNPDHDVFAGSRLEVQTVREDAEPPSERKHGTAVVAILIGAPGSRVPGLLPDSRVIAVDPFSRGRGGDERSDVFALVAAVETLLERDARVVNLSLTGPPNQVLEETVRRALDTTALVAAVGNGGPRAHPLYPAAYEGVIGVTAVDRRKRLYRRALRGEQVDFAAPGVELPTAASIRGVRPQTGTSFAAPFVTAAAAALLSVEPDLTAETLRTRLAEAAEDLGEPGADPEFGAGLINGEGLCSPSVRTADPT